MDQETRRIVGLYEGEGGAIWDRVELGRPGTYIEENTVLGRREEVETLLYWLGDAAGQRILDAGCGRGRLALRLAQEGAQVTAVDLSRRALGAANAEAAGVSFIVGDVRRVLHDPGEAAPFDVVVAREVLQDYAPTGRNDLLSRLTSLGARRLYLTLRLESRWMYLVRTAWPRGLAETVDPVPVLRWLHTTSPYRLTRQQTVRRRSFQSQLLELSHR